MASLAVVLALVLLGSTFAAQKARAQDFISTSAAFEQGIQAYRAGYVGIAIPALKFAAARNSLLARFYLARIYADTTTARTDHGKAYRYYLEIVRDNLDIDADIDPRALYVARSLTALAGYIRTGVPSIGVKANPSKAAVYLRHSANHFGDADAQFELAKLYLRGEGVAQDISLARHLLSVLTTQKSHAVAQAFLADMLWRGRYVNKNRGKALALITVAVANAPEEERFWIEDIYQNIYCGTPRGIRKQVSGYVADWRKQYGGKILRPRRPASSDLPQAVRTCGNGDSVAPVKRSEAGGWLRPATTVAPDAGQGEPPAMRGDVGGFSLRSIGDSAPQR